MAQIHPIKRALAALFGAIIFMVIVPVGYYLAFEKVPLGSFQGIILLVAIGFAVGALLGALLPRLFGFVFESFLGV